MLPRPLPGQKTLNSFALTVVYALKTSDYRFFATFYPARRLSQECKNRGIPLRFFFVEDALQLLDSTIYNPDSRRSTVILLRGATLRTVGEQLAVAGYTCINPPAAQVQAQDKLATATFLENADYPTITTLTAEQWLADPILPCSAKDPLVAKPRYGSRGRGVHLVYSAEDIALLGKDYLIQQYIAHSHGRDLRFFFINGKITASCERHSRDKSLISNSSNNGQMRILTAEESSLYQGWQDRTLEIAAAAGLFYGTVDYLFTGAGPEDLTVCEINSSPGFEELEKVSGKNIAGALVDALSDLAEQLL